MTRSFRDDECLKREQYLLTLNLNFKIEFCFLIDLLHCYIAGVLIKNNFVDLFCEQMFQQQVMVRVDLDG